MSNPYVSARRVSQEPCCRTNPVLGRPATCEPDCLATELSGLLASVATRGGMEHDHGEGGLCSLGSLRYRPRL
jgi:hypothetical protein